MVMGSYGKHQRLYLWSRFNLGKDFPQGCFSLAYIVQQKESSITKTVSRRDALTAILDTAEELMRSMKLTKDENERNLLKSQSQALLYEADMIKNSQTWPLPRETISETKLDQIQGQKIKELKQPVSTRALSTREQIIILQGSKLNGCVFPPWKCPPGTSDFDLDNESEPFT